MLHIFRSIGPRALFFNSKPCICLFKITLIHIRYESLHPSLNFPYFNGLLWKEKNKEKRFLSETYLTTTNLTLTKCPVHTYTYIYYLPQIWTLLLFYPLNGAGHQFLFPLPEMKRFAFYSNNEKSVTFWYSVISWYISEKRVMYLYIHKWFFNTVSWKSDFFQKKRILHRCLILDHLFSRLFRNAKTFLLPFYAHHL